jgi:type I restriction enzyme S subunit
VCLRGQDTAINQDLRGIVPKAPGLLLVRYLFWWLKSVADSIVAEGTGATVQGVKLPFVKSLQVPLPPLPEQQRIVATLDEASAAIARARSNTERNLRNARELFEGHVDAVFSRRDEGWLESRLGDLVECISTGPFGSILHKSDYQHGGVPLVNPINIEGDKIVPDGRKAVGSETAQRLARYALRENDLLVGRRGEIGRCAVVTRDQSGWLCGTGCFFIRPSGRTDPYFLTHLLRSRPYRARLEGMAARATMPSISNDDLADLIVMLPPVTQQRRISALLDDLAGRTESLASIYERKLAALDALKQSLLHQAFTGAL